MLTETITLRPNPAKLGNHPAKMHPDLALRLVLDYTSSGQTVLDPFVGIGTTLWAAAECGREGIGVDIEARFASDASRYGLVVVAEDLLQ